MINPEIDIHGNKQWYNTRHQLHREDGPAIVEAIGIEQWYCNGKLHRLDGPAIVYPNGDKVWYKHGKKHREDGPAVDNVSLNVLQWFCQDQLHRISGPAIIWGDNTCDWYLHGKKVKFNEYCRQLNISEQEQLVLALKYGITND